MPAVLVYRDRLLAPPEGFVPRQYLAFRELVPLFVGCVRDSAFDRLGPDAVVLPELATVGRLDVVMFKQFGVVPAAFLALAKSRDVRLVHAQFGRGGALALPIARALGVPLVVTFHGGDATKDRHFRKAWPVPTVFQRRWPELQRESCCFLCVSDFIRQRLRDRGAPDALLAVHYLGVEIPPLPRQPGQPSNRFLGVGRFVAKKGFATAIEALRAVRCNGLDVGLDLIGDGPLRAGLEAAAKDLPVRFLGWQTPDAVGSAMGRALGLVVPSRTAANGDGEGLPTVVLEAQARGLPVVATNHAGIPEAVTDGVTGLLAEEADVAGLADAIGRLAASPALRASLRDHGLQSVRRDFDATRQSERLEQRLLALIDAPAACSGGRQH